MTYLFSLVILIFTLCPAWAISSSERHAALSCSRKHIELLPELVLTENIAPQGQIIFLHIPKTAGTNLDAIASAMSQKTGKFHYQRLAVPRVPGRSPILITATWLGGLQQLVNKPNLLENIEDNFFLSGHFPYGLHRHFSSPSKYVALFRHPLERELSSANFDYQRKYIEAEQLEFYLMDEMIDNPQVRLIAGTEYMTGVCSAETLAKAKENIERDFLLVAPHEDVNSFIQILASIQGWGIIAYAPLQITREKAVEELNPALTEALMKKHAWDLEFYQWVKERWYQWKEQIIHSSKVISPDEHILTLMPDFPLTHQAVYLTPSEIDAYNQRQNGELLEISQQHRGLP
jgi:hypothetical protein